MIRLFLISIFSVIVSHLSAQTSFDKVNGSVNITVDDEQRSYWLYVPSGCKPNAPMVLAMHGASGHSYNNSPNFNSLADKEKFIVVYPQGKDIYFPVFGGTVTGWDASGEDNNDVKFIRAVVDEVTDKYAVDRKRIYACGFSNGGMMSYALTNTCADLFAAFASISGFPLNEFHFRHVGARPVPFLHIHGKNDDFVKYSLMPIIVDEMVARIGAKPVPDKTSVSGKYDRSVYAATDGGFPYVYYEIDGMGHNDYTSNTAEGNSSLTMWNFFKQYTLDLPCDWTLKWRPNLETDGYSPKEHGWTQNAGVSLLMFGKDQNSSSNQNVYYSFQLDNGFYKLKFNAAGDPSNKINVRIQKLTDNRRTVLNDTLMVAGETTLFFKVEDGYGEYRFLIRRVHSSDQTTITDLALYSATEEETSSVREYPEEAVLSSEDSIYSLSGIKKAGLGKGVNIIQTENGKTKKVLVR